VAVQISRLTRELPRPILHVFRVAVARRRLERVTLAVGEVEAHRAQVALNRARLNLVQRTPLRDKRVALALGDRLVEPDRIQDHGGFDFDCCRARYEKSEG